MLLAGMAKGAAIGAAVGGATSAITGGDVGMGMLTGAIGGVFFGGAGAIVHGMEIAGTVSSVIKAGIHAGAGVLSGGINASITHSDIGMGMLTGGLAAGISAYVGAEWLPKNDAIQTAGRVLLGGTIGGAIYEMYGGDFGQGFIKGGTASLLGELLNDQMSPKKEKEQQQAEKNSKALKVEQRPTKQQKNQEWWEKRGVRAIGATFMALKTGTTCSLALYMLSIPFISGVPFMAPIIWIETFPVGAACYLEIKHSVHQITELLNEDN